MDNRQSKNHQLHHLMDVGEPSTARRTRTASSPDAPNLELDRPFKKARYVWQLKGKYHLKADSKKPQHRHNHRRNTYNIRHSNSSNSSDTDSDSENKSHISNKKNDSSFINSLLVRSEALLNDEKVCEDEHITNIDKAISDDIPVTLVKPNNQSQDEYYLEKWQARQMAKSYVDNTINALLELWKIAPYDASDLVENCENDEQVEDEGILMAIQSHGLQTGFPSSGLTNNQSTTTASTSHTVQAAGSNCNDSNQNILREPMHISDSGDSGDSDHFLTAAVSAAIQKKGLSNYNYG